MKSCWIITPVVFLISVFSNKIFAQLPHGGLYVHALYASPLDKSSKKFYNGGAGAAAGILAGKKTTRFNASVGYLYLLADKSENVSGSQVYIPFKAGIRQYLPLTLHTLFIQGNAGVGFVSYKNNANNDSRFAFDFGAGIKLTTFEAALLWENFKEKNPSGYSSWLTIQAGFNIGL